MEVRINAALCFQLQILQGLGHEGQKLRGGVGVIDQHIDGPVFLHDSVDERLPLVGLCHIHSHGQDFGTLFLADPFGLLQLGECAAAYSKLRTLLREPDSFLLAETAGTAGDDTHFSIEFSHSTQLLFVLFTGMLS